MRTYSELIKLPTFRERFEYLKVTAPVGGETFGALRWLNQRFYKSPLWSRAKREVILRDNGCDLGLSDRKIMEGAVVHHMCPITYEQLARNDPCLYEPELLITVSSVTHRAIHYSEDPPAPYAWTARTMNDTCPWR